MQIEIDLNTSVDENAGTYFDLAKKAKRKIEGAKKAIEDSKKKLADLQGKENSFLEEEKKRQAKKEIKREWYEKFHWFISSEGLLCIGGKDATSNEIIIKKHLEPDDLVFHTELPGSPFFLIKGGQKCGEATKEETAQATAVYSKSWKAKHTQGDVFYVLPEQVTKEAKSGEFIAKGAFMIYGKRNVMHPVVEMAMGLVEGKTIGGPVNAVKSQTDNFAVIIPGDLKKSDLAKRIKFKLKGGDLDDIVTFLPAGEGEVKK
ncbi:MAG: NFACT RNA binding domain-containing protein [Candidatus Woesearchaeota archaeon]|jgi:predicted ribosome quality control (RQC) complex YloA/Tae2 family protein